MKYLFLLTMLTAGLATTSAAVDETARPSATPVSSVKTVNAGQQLQLPPRAENAPGARALLPTLGELSLADRESEIVGHVLAGNVPQFLRALRPVRVTAIADGRSVEAVFWAAPDYLAVGSDDDFFLTPLSPRAAQRIADAVGCQLPTRRMVDAIYAAATVRLAPITMTPGAEMTTLKYFRQHDESVRLQRTAVLKARPPGEQLGELVAGHKKDVVITPRLSTAPGKVAIYGWHREALGDRPPQPIQPLYLGHIDQWVDYSHGVRLISQRCTINGAERNLAEVLADVQQCVVFSDEGPIVMPRYGGAPNGTVRR